MEKLPGKGMVTASSLIMLIWGLVNAGYYDIAKLVLADEPTGALDSKSAKLLLDRLKHLNEDLMTTILMVTHDSFTASYAGRILFIKDGKVFHELRRGGDTRKEFFNKIIDVVTLLGGDLNDAL